MGWPGGFSFKLIGPPTPIGTPWKKQIKLTQEHKILLKCLQFYHRAMISQHIHTRATHPLKKNKIFYYSGGETFSNKSVIYVVTVTIRWQNAK